MRLLLLKPFLLARSNGGEISLIERLERLQSMGVEIQIEIACAEASRCEVENFLTHQRTPLQSDLSYKVGKLRCHLNFDPHFHPHELWAQKPMEEFFWQKIDEFRPQICVAHYTDFFAMSAAVKWNASRAFILQTDDEFPRLDVLQDFPSVHSVAKNIKNFVVNSSFLKGEVQKAFPGATAYWVPNPIRAPESHATLQPQFWLFVNPVPVKGLDFMLKLVRELPEEEFLFLGNWTNERPDPLPKNVRWMPRQESLDTIFRQSKGLLMPSVWKEAFGRLALEAMQAKVPVIASDRGALPDTVGNGGLSLPLDLEAWLAVIRNADDPWRQHWIERGQDRFERYQKDVDRRFQAIRRALTYLN